MSKKLIFYIVFFVVLIFGFYVALSAIIPNFDKKRINPVSYVRPFAFPDQDGRMITNKDVEGKVYVAEYFFTTCKGICPRMNNNMKTVFEKYRNERDFMILSHTCDPENDSVAVLKHYSDSMGLASTNWLFLTGRKDSLYNMARVSYAIDDPQDKFTNVETSFLHTQFWALVDKGGNVVKIYDGLKKDEVNAVIKDIDRLLKNESVY